MHIKEEMLTIVGAAILLWCGYYCLRWTGKVAELSHRDRKRPLSEGHIRFIGWMALAGGLLMQYVAIRWIIETSRAVDY